MTIQRNPCSSGDAPIIWPQKKILSVHITSRRKSIGSWVYIYMYACDLTNLIVSGFPTCRWNEGNVNFSSYRTTLLSTSLLLHQLLGSKRKRTPPCLLLCAPLPAIWQGNCVPSTWSTDTVRFLYGKDLMGQALGRLAWSSSSRLRPQQQDQKAAITTFNLAVWGKGGGGHSA